VYCRKLDAKKPRAPDPHLHTYLRDWVRTQESGVANGIDGAAPRLAAALDLKRRLQLILEGEQPYDIFVRWKSLVEQHIGWNPHLNDRVRLNIRPFLTAKVLRHNKKPKLNNGERINDHHTSLAEKRAGVTSGSGRR
jgi:hypothetical protein